MAFVLLNNVLDAIYIIEGIYLSLKDIRECKVCGRMFIPLKGNQVCCSSRCSRKNAKQTMKEYEKTHQKRLDETPCLEIAKEKAINDANGQCELTGNEGHHCHHLNGYKWYEPGRDDVDNLILLDRDVHMLFHKEYGKYNNTVEQFIFFVKKHFPNRLPYMLEKYYS